MARALADREGLKRAVLARVAAGATVEAACAPPHGPAAWNVRRWARGDPAFRAALDAAIASGRHRRLYAYDPVKAEALLARAWAGEALVRLIGQPGMPGWKTYRHWRKTQGAFAEAVWAIRQRQRAQLAYQGGPARRRAWDPAAGDRIIAALHRTGSLEAVLKADPALPGREVVRRWRAEQPDFDAAVAAAMAGWRRRRVRARLYRPAVVERVLDHVRAGGTLAGAARAVAGAPSCATLYHWMATIPEFAERVGRAYDDRADWWLDEILTLGPGKGASAAVRRLEGRLARNGRRRPGTRKASS